MANPIQKNDLISDEALEALKEMSRLLREDKENMNELMASFKQYADSIKPAVAANNSNNDALAAALQKVSELEKAYSDLQKLMKENNNTRKAINEEKRKYKKLTDEEKASVIGVANATKMLAEEIKKTTKIKEEEGGRDEDKVKYAKKVIESINEQKMSYNQLQQTYNAIMDTIKKMSIEEVRSSEAGKLMVNTAKQLRDTMNETQKSVGNYTLQVGKYRAAFDGLGYSFQQILREIPSALNPQQFFLAISNNIPLFMDQVKAFKNEQSEIKDKMKELEDAGQKATKEYEELGNKVTSFGAKMRRSIFSWQTAILALVLLLRKYGQDILDWFGNLFSSTMSMAKKTEEYLNTVFNEARATTKEQTTELELLLKRMDGLNTKSTEYKNIVSQINEITGSTWNYLTDMPSKIREATQEYIRQQEQLAVNAAIISKLSGSKLVTSVVGMASGGAYMHGESIDKFFKGLISDEDDLKYVSDLLATVNTLKFSLESGWNPSITAHRFRLGNAVKQQFQYMANTLDAAFGDGSLQPDVPLLGRSQIGYQGVENRRMTDSERTKYQKELAEYEKILYSELEKYGYIPTESVQALEGAYKVVGSTKGTGGKKQKEFTFSPGNVDDRYWEAQRAYIELTKQGYEKEMELQELAHEKELKENDDFLIKRRKQLEENLLGQIKLMTNGDEKKAYEIFNRITSDDEAVIAKLSKEEAALRDNFWKQEFEGRVQHNAIRLHLVEENEKKINSIKTKYAEMDRKVVVEEELGWIEEMDEAYKVEDNRRRRRIKTVKDEEQNNQRLSSSITKMREEIEKLEELNLTEPESIEKRTARIQELRKSIEQLQTQIDHTKKLSTYSSFGDIFRRNVNINSGTQQSLMESILGKDAYSDFTPGSQALQDAIEKDFDTWMQSVEQSLSTWYTTTMDYINDLISAYVELANAKAEAAKEATDAAQEEYDKEKALLEAGYASRVEATWAEYQEKKAAQEKAEEDAKAAAKAQQEINNLSTMGSLITAAANIWKTFTEIPVVGIPLAIAATGTMFGAFLAAKIKANEVSKYGEGGFEVLEGGSHASGHDIDLGVKNRKGRRMRAEGKEGLGIFSRRAMSHYGDRNIEGFVNSINRLEFEGNAAKRMSLERSVGMAVLSAPRTDLHKVESDLHKLVSYGARSRTVNADGSVTEIRKNAKIVYKNG